MVEWNETARNSQKEPEKNGTTKQPERARKTRYNETARKGRRIRSNGYGWKGPEINWIERNSCNGPEGTRLPRSICPFW
jgi:hypothetical protein